jgi:hypothetical protein
MSYVVRHKGTGRYLEGRDQWTSHLESALQFNSGLKLVSYIEHGNVHESQDSLEILAVPAVPQSALTAV